MTGKRIYWLMVIIFLTYILVYQYWVVISLLCICLPKEFFSRWFEGLFLNVFLCVMECDLLVSSWHWVTLMTGHTSHNKTWQISVSPKSQLCSTTYLQPPVKSNAFTWNVKRSVVKYVYISLLWQMSSWVVFQAISEDIESRLIISVTLT